MSIFSLYKLNKGYNIKISDGASLDVCNAIFPDKIAIKPIDFVGLKLNPVVKVGDQISAGDILGFDKQYPKIKLTTPVAGKVLDIKRGKRRLITQIVLETDKQSNDKTFEIPSELSRDDILEILLDSGMFLQFKQRPFNIIASPDMVPRDIFISAILTYPMAPDVKILMDGNQHFLQKGISVLSKLTSGKVHLSHSPDNKKIFSDFKDCNLNVFEGAHPAGNVGIQIHHISPILNRNDVVWTCSLAGLIRLGRLFYDGILDSDCLVKVSGSGAFDKQYYRTKIGSPVSIFVKVKDCTRIISGDVLTGRQVESNGFLGFFDNLVSVLPETKKYEFIGWLTPGLSKLSRSRSFLSSLNPFRKFYNPDTNYHGSNRAFVATGIYKDVLPMDIYPVFLMKSILVKDIEEMEQLGIYEIVEEDIALCEYICPSKIEWQEILRQGLGLIEKEG